MRISLRGKNYEVITDATPQVDDVIVVNERVDVWYSGLVTEIDPDGYWSMDWTGDTFFTLKDDPIVIFRHIEGTEPLPTD